MSTVSGSGSSQMRSASSGSIPVAAIALAVVFIISPIAVVVAAITVALVVRQRNKHWWETAVWGGVLAVVVALVEQFVAGGFLAFHFGGYASAFGGAGGLIGAIARTIPFGIPAGIVAGAAFVGASESSAAGAEWHAMEKRRREVNANKAERRIKELLALPELRRATTSQPLGVIRDGDLATWMEDPYVVVPSGQFPAMGILGESGSGKTVTAERMVGIWAQAGRKLVFLDFKGTDPELAERMVAAYLRFRPDAIVAQWPDQPLDMWRGKPDEIINRLLMVQEYTEPYYKAIATNAINLVMKAPDVEHRGSVRSSKDFLDRLDVDYLRRSWTGYPLEMALIEDFVKDPKALAGVRHRYAGFFSSLAGQFDGEWSFEDVDLAILATPAMRRPEDAQAVAKMLLADFASYCVGRKPRIGEDTTLVVDEFSAVTEAASQVIQIAERVRDVGGQVVVSVQNYEGLGTDDAERRRMRDALAPGGLIVHRLGNPDDVLSVAGTVRAVEHSTQVDHLGPTGLGTTKMAHKMKVDPDAVRQASKGEAWVITGGRAVHLSVIQTKISDADRDRARYLVRSSRRRVWAEAVRTPAERPDWWDKRLTMKEPPSLEVPDLLAIGPGGDPTPPELPPVAAPLPDARLILLIAAYVRAGLIEQARVIAKRTAGITNPSEHVDALAAERIAVLEQAESARRRLRRRRRS